MHTSINNFIFKNLNGYPLKQFYLVARKDSTGSCQWLVFDNMHTCTCIDVTEFKFLLVRAWTLNSKGLHQLPVTMVVVMLTLVVLKRVIPFVTYRIPREALALLHPNAFGANTTSSCYHTCMIVYVIKIKCIEFV